MQESLTQVSETAASDPDVFWALLVWAAAMVALSALLILRAADPLRRRRGAAAVLLLYAASPFVQVFLANLLASIREGRPFPRGLLFGPIWYPPLAGLAGAAAALLWLWMKGRMGGEADSTEDAEPRQPAPRGGTSPPPSA